MEDLVRAVKRIKRDYPDTVLPLPATAGAVALMLGRKSATASTWSSGQVTPARKIMMLVRHLLTLLDERDDPDRVLARYCELMGREAAARGVALADSVRQLAGLSVFAHVKDARGTPEKFEFLLPGEHGTDYRELARLLPAAGYRGPVVVEVSGQISNRPGYDPAAAARTSYANLAAAFGRPVRK